MALRQRLFEWYVGASNLNIYCVPKTWWPADWRRAKKLTKFIDCRWEEEHIEERIIESVRDSLVTGRPFSTSQFVQRWLAEKEREEQKVRT